MDKEKALKNLLDVTEVFKENKIPIWLDNGTLLGAIREKNFIEWDNDVDLNSWRSYFNSKKTKKKITKELEKKGFVTYYSFNGIEIKRYGISCSVGLIEEPENNIIIIEDKNLNGVSKFIKKIKKITTNQHYGSFNFSKSNGIRFMIKVNLFKMVSYIPLCIRKAFYNLVKFVIPNQKGEKCKLVFSKEHYTKLNDINFFGFDFKMPSNTEEYLTKVYGNWKKPPKDINEWYRYGEGDWK